MAGWLDLNKAQSKTFYCSMEQGGERKGREGEAFSGISPRTAIYSVPLLSSTPLQFSEAGEAGEAGRGTQVGAVCCLKPSPQASQITGVSKHYVPSLYQAALSTFNFVHM